VSNARRAGWIDWEVIVDTSERRERPPNVWDDAEMFVKFARQQAGTIRLDRQTDQETRLLIADQPAWPDGPHLHHRTVTYSPWEDA
jgi:hypothetical protein